ncbi:hypothetical protein [Paracoccus homiensis]|uniref:DUF2946 domain-containing protein n=1 Tax=Paracoccus homiensis TaxID=364199 RepID=A0A1I0BUL2_9RHOB|nr:hypothetical protein [Paracoccus homiensis]SET10751.1 hypothetical protein SAMN04489858_10365 [Paracoccus homiensis]
MGNALRSIAGIALALCVLLGGLGAATMIAPSPDRQQLHSIQMVFGDQLGELCGTMPGHDHHCPFCHALPEAPVAQRAQVVTQFLPGNSWAILTDLTRDRAWADHLPGVRAPPVPA